VIRLAGPLKVLTQRFAFLALLALALGLLALGRADPRLMERGRAVIVDASAPVLGVLSRPVEAAQAVVGEARALLDLHGENAALREENRRLRDWQTAARRLEQENASLKALLALRPEPRTTVVAARVIADGGGPFVRTLVIDAGTEAGVEDGHVVVDGAGVVGRITAVGRSSSRVLLLTDLNSRIPVRIEGTRQRAVLAGDNSDRPRLAFLPATVKVRPGDRLVTSGDGGLFPAGLPIGVVENVGTDGIRVRPWSSLEAMELIRVVRYDARPLSLDGIEDEDQSEPRRLAPKAPVTIDPAEAAQAAAPGTGAAIGTAQPRAATPPPPPPEPASDPDAAASDRPE
jgi:rod shape-determining protein MreC